jgi:hypothetical protein
VALRRRLLPHLTGFGWTFGDADALGVGDPERIHRVGVTLIGGPLPPDDRLADVGRSGPAFCQTQADGVGGGALSGIGGGAQRLQRGAVTAPGALHRLLHGIAGTGLRSRGAACEQERREATAESDRKETS